MRSFVTIKLSRNGEITLSFTDAVYNSCSSRYFWTSKNPSFILMISAKIKIPLKFPNLRYTLLCCSWCFSSISIIFLRNRELVALLCCVCCSCL